jgi:UDP-N-acetylglucosamine acyltransferase
MATNIDPRANVSTKAELGNNITIGPFTTVEAGAVIGDGTTVAANALIASGARIGKENVIHHGAVIGHSPQDLKYKNEPTTCELGVAMLSVNMPRCIAQRWRPIARLSATIIC